MSYKYEKSVQIEELNSSLLIRTFTKKSGSLKISISSNARIDKISTVTSISTRGSRSSPIFNSPLFSMGILSNILFSISFFEFSLNIASTFKLLIKNVPIMIIR